MGSSPEIAVPLYAYQHRWISDHSRFRFAVKSVQIGWSWAEALNKALAMIERKHTFLWMSGSQRQSREAAEYVKMHLRAMGAVGQLDTNVEEFFGDTKMLVDRVITPNGARGFFLPANPETARGFSGDVVLDEFASHKNPKAIWAAMFGRVSRGYSLTVFSSPKGAIGKFYDLAKKLGLSDGVAPGGVQPVKRGGWSGHWCDIHMAIADGCPLNAAELREAMDDDDTYAQEYLCQFLDAARQYISTELIEEAVSADATMELPSHFAPRGPVWLGEDVGRTSDYTVHALIEQLGERFVTRGIDLMRKAQFSVQKARTKTFLPLVRRAAIDGSGLGMQNAEELVKEHPGKVEAVNFDNESKGIMAAWMKRKFEDHLIEIPNDELVKTHIKSIKRLITESNNVRFDAARTKDGHGDIFWALALAVHASDRPHTPMSEGTCVGRSAMRTADIDGSADDSGLDDESFYSDDDDDALVGRSVYERML